MGFLSYFFKKSSKQPTDACCLCKKALVGQVVQDAWGNSAHLAHGISFCGTCDRILSRYSSAGAFQYSDGRLICGLCKKIAVTDGVSANRSRRKIVDLLESVGFKGIPKNVKIVLTHAEALSAHSNKKNTAGLTLTQVHFHNYKRIGATHQIGILSGLPKPEFEATLAHELLHVWQQENGIKLSPLYCEGLCELGSFLIYSKDSSPLGKHLLEKLMKNKDLIYGNGFRLFHKKIQNLGWEKMIREVLKNKQGFEESILKKIFFK